MGNHPFIHFVCGIIDAATDDPRHVRTVDVDEIMLAKHINDVLDYDHPRLSTAYLQHCRRRDGDIECALSNALHNPSLNHSGENYRPGTFGQVIGNLSGSESFDGTAVYALFNALPEFDYRENRHQGVIEIARRAAYDWERIEAEQPNGSNLCKFCVRHGLLWHGYDYIDCFMYATEARALMAQAGWEVPYTDLKLFITWGWI